MTRDCSKRFLPNLAISSRIVKNDVSNEGNLSKHFLSDPTSVRGAWNQPLQVPSIKAVSIFIGSTCHMDSPFRMLVPYYL
jgi:hypothetical protein